MTSKPWWQTDEYDLELPLPVAFEQRSGPKGVALVKAWPDGRTDQGWGLQGPESDPNNGFMRRYPRGEFNSRRVLYGYNKGKWNFAIVMRSVRLVCIDIDGKNGGLEHAKRLGMLPYTLAETSKSGDGFHLFYEVEDKWDPGRGYGLLGDRIGIEQGVDIRATGCVYHYPQQRWNGRGIAMLPDHLKTIMLSRDQKVAESNRRITAVLQSNDEIEVLLMHDQLINDLQQPLPQGKRNNTLFAIGSQLQQAQVPKWDELVHARAIEVGLSQDEADKIVTNIIRYAGQQAVTP